MPFDIGDKAYVPNHGVGIVKEIQTVDLGGASYQMYVIKILDDGLTYFVPVDGVGANGIREVIPSEAVDKVYEVLRDTDTPANNQTWNRRYREYSTKIKTGDPLEVAAVLRELARLKVEKTLSFGERKMYDQAHSLIVQELAVAKDVDEQVIKDEIEAIFVKE
jgi:CarD family transcriptional regulator